MSSIHYKFKATLEYKTLVFDGLHISVNDLKKEICEKENIKAESFDLVLTNAHTKRQYFGEELIPRNSSVIVQRTPRDNAVKLPKVQDTSNSGIVSKSATSEKGMVEHIESEEFEKMTEEERLAHVKEVSSYKYLPSNFQKKTSSIMSGPPPPTYVCNRCSQSGHWYKNCPMLNTRRTTGITMEELMETTPDDPLAMLHPSGKFVVPIMHWKARQKKPEILAAEPEIREVPPELKCPLCSQLLRDAVLTTCCGDSFCAECVQQRLLDSSNAKCPGADCFQTAVSADKLVPNLKMRQAVEAFKHSFIQGMISSHNADSAGTSRTEEAPQIVPRVRIGLGLRSQPSQPQPLTHIPTTTIAEQKPAPQTAVPVQVSVDAQPPPSIPQAMATIAPRTTQVSVMPINVSSTMTSSTVPVAMPTLNAMQMTATSILPMNVHQPPPGYPIIPTPLMNTNSGESIATRLQQTSSLGIINVSNISTLLPPGVQPPPPGLPATTTFPRVPAPPPIKDAWDEFLERKEKESRQRASMPSQRRRRRSTRSSSYSSNSSSGSTSGTLRSRNRSRSHSRERNVRRRNVRRIDKRTRRREMRSPPRSSYASMRYHHREVTNQSSFNLYQNPMSGPGPIGVPGISSMGHHRIPPLLGAFPNYTQQQLQQQPPNVGVMNNYSSYSNPGTNGGYRQMRMYNEERMPKRRSPRHNEFERRGVQARRRENDEETEKRVRVDEKREERARKEEKTQRSKPREEKLHEMKQQKQRDKPVKRRHDIVAAEESEFTVDPLCEKSAAEVETSEAIEDRIEEAPPVEKSEERANAPEVVVETAHDGALGVVAYALTTEDDGSGAEVENENEEMKKTTADVESVDKEEKKKHKKKKKHRSKTDEPGHRKHHTKKHKKTKEEKQKHKEEKMKRREEKRKRKAEQIETDDVGEQDKMDSHEEPDKSDGAKSSRYRSEKIKDEKNDGKKDKRDLGKEESLPDPKIDRKHRENHGVKRKYEAPHEDKKRPRHADAEIVKSREKRENEVMETSAKNSSSKQAYKDENENTKSSHHERHSTRHKVADKAISSRDKNDNFRNAGDHRQRNVVAESSTTSESSKKRLVEIKQSIEKEIVKKHTNFDRQNLTVELKSGGEKKVTRENVFESVAPQFNARQKIKMILLSESERNSTERSRRKFI